MTTTERQILLNQQLILEALWNLQKAVAGPRRHYKAFESTEDYLRLKGAGSVNNAPNGYWVMHLKADGKSIQSPESIAGTQRPAPRLIKDRRG